MFCCPRNSKTSPSHSIANVEKSDEKQSTIVEKVLCAIGDDFPNGSKREFEVNGTTILVIHDQGKYFAVAGLCTHYNARLVNGYYRDKTIRCPAHGAKFHVDTGDIEDYPGFACLPTYEVFVRGSYLVLEVKESSLSTVRRELEPPKTLKKKEHETLPIVVIGTGPAAITFVETLRKLGNDHPIVMITKEYQMPYDRVILNKKIHKNVKEILLHSEEWYNRMNIDVRTGSTVLNINHANCYLSLSTSSAINYSKLLIATGCSPRKITVEGNKLANVFYMRTIEDAVQLAEKSSGEHVVCIGGSFIGMEAASILSTVAESVTVVCSTEEPVPAFGNDIGATLRKFFETRGIRVITRARMEKLKGSEMGRVESVHLADGEVLQTDCVLVGIGVRPESELFISSNIPLCSTGYVVTDEDMQTPIKNIWAAGDITRFVLPLWNDSHAHIEHFQVAQRQGQMAAYSLMRKSPTPSIVPFFWGRFFNEITLKFTGYAENHNSTFVRGDLPNFEFTKYFFQDDRVVAVASCGSKNTAVHFIPIFEQGIVVDRKTVENNEEDDWSEWVLLS